MDAHPQQAHAEACLDDLLYGIALALRQLARGESGRPWWMLAELGRRSLLALLPQGGPDALP